MFFLTYPPFGRPLRYINFPFKIIIQKYLLNKSVNEWKRSRKEKNGSEMYLLFEGMGL